MLKKVLLVVVILTLGFAGGLFFREYQEKNRESAPQPAQNNAGQQVYTKDTGTPAASGKPSETMANSAPKISETVVKNTPTSETVVRGTSQPLSVIPPEVKKQTSPEPPAESKPIAAETSALQSSIEQKYISKLQSLASLYEGKLNGLVGAAMAEYNAARKNNPNVDVAAIFNKYYAQAKSLEAQCDSEVYPVLTAFESELAANSLPTDAAARAKASYESQKSARASILTRVNP